MGCILSIAESWYIKAMGNVLFLKYTYTYILCFEIANLVTIFGTVYSRWDSSKENTNVFLRKKMEVKVWSFLNIFTIIPQSRKFGRS